MDGTLPYRAENVIGFYTRGLQAHGVSAYAQGWVSRASQYKRFQVLAEIGTLQNASVLDVGCGVGDFHAYLQERGIAVHYVGLDFTPEMIAIARERFPDCAFLFADILADNFPLTLQADYVVASGLFSHMNATLFHQAIPRLFALCRKGLAFNVLSIHDPDPDPTAFHASPMEAFEFCRELTPRLALRHDYMPHDFTCYLYKTDPD